MLLSHCAATMHANYQEAQWFLSEIAQFIQTTWVEHRITKVKAFYLMWIWLSQTKMSLRSTCDHNTSCVQQQKYPFKHCWGKQGNKKKPILHNQRHNLTIYTPSHFKSYRYIYRSFMASQGSIKPRLFYRKLALPWHLNVHHTLTRVFNARSSS